MRYRQSFLLIIGTVVVFAVWELIGHLFLMTVPMDERHGLSIIIGTGLALVIATVSIQAIWHQQKELHELARLRDYLIRMQAHYLHLSPDARTDPQQQLEYKALEMKYAEIQKSLASQRPETRASGLLDLWELAQTHLIGLREPYPFFFCAVSHLTAVLYLESEIPPREQAQHALEAMSVFARDNEPRLLIPLIEDLAHANRSAMSALTDALAERFATTDTASEDDFKLLLPLIRFTDSEETDIMVLHDLFDSSPCQEKLVAQRVLQKAGKTQKPDESSLLNRIRSAAVSLRDTRSALAKALCALPAPDDIPADSATRRNWKRARPLSLQNCFLVGVDLSKAHLQGVDLQHTAMQAANLTDSQLQNSDLAGSNLWKAQLFAARLEDARLWGANLRDASLPAAHLEGADMSRTHLQGAHLIGAYLTSTCLWQATIIDEAAKREHTAVFTDANWWDASFTDRLTGSTDTEVQTWLRNSFPQPMQNAPAVTTTLN